MIGIFRKNLRFFVQEKVYEIQDQKFHGFAPKCLHFDAPRGCLQIDAQPESDVFIVLLVHCYSSVELTHVAWWDA